MAGSSTPNPASTPAGQSGAGSSTNKSTEATTAKDLTADPSMNQTNTSNAGGPTTSKPSDTSAGNNTAGQSTSTVKTGFASSKAPTMVTTGATDNGTDSGINVTETDMSNKTDGLAKGPTAAPSPTSASNSSASVSQPNNGSTNVSTSTAAPVTDTPTPSATPKTPVVTKTTVTVQTTENGTNTVTTNTTQSQTTVVTSKPETPKPANTTQNQTSAVPETTVNNTSTVTPKPSTTTTTPSTKAPETTATTKPSSSKATTTTNGTSATSATGAPTTTIALAPSSATVAPAGTTGKVTPAPSVNETVYINEIMVNKDGGFQKIELFMSAAADVSHYAMVIVDGSTREKAIFYLKNITVQQKNGFLTIDINSTLHAVKGLGTGIAVYDTNFMSNLAEANWTLSDIGLMDALVIGKTYNISTPLLKTLTTDNNPFVIDPAIYGSMKTISRCSLASVKNTDMFMLTNSSLGGDNNDTCEAKRNIQKTLVLKFDAQCNTLNDTMVRKIMKYVVKEVNRDCHCGITRRHVQDITVSCCDETLLKIKFVIPSNSKDTHLLTSFKKFIDHINSSIPLAKKTYKLDKKCDDYKACCQTYKSCCQQPEPVKHDDTGKNVKVTVAAVVSCLVVFLVIVVLVIMYMRRKKTVNYQFRMSRLQEDDEDLMMDGAEGDDFVGGQEATFDIKS